jgi:glycerol-3-phosphate acyltransferase PlsY
MLFYSAVILIAYLVGAIPSGYWFAKYFFDTDITKHGSKNIGATNVARVLGEKKYFFLIFFFDFFKAFIFSSFFQAHIFPLCAIALLVGNGHSIFLRFRGGKGISTMLGILGVFPALFFGFIFVWSVAAWYWRRVDVASLLATLSLLTWYTVPANFFLPPILLVVFFVVWVFFRHRENMREMFL